MRKIYPKIDSCKATINQLIKFPLFILISLFVLSCSKYLDIGNEEKIPITDSTENLKSLLKSNSDYKALTYYWSNKSRKIHDDSLRRDNPDCQNVDLAISYVGIKYQKISEFIDDNPQYKGKEQIIIELLSDFQRHETIFAKTKVDYGTAYCVEPIVKAVNTIVHLFIQAREFCPKSNGDIYFDEVIHRLNLMMNTNAFSDATYYYQHLIYENDIIIIIESGRYGAINWNNIIRECNMSLSMSSIRNAHREMGCCSSSGGGGGGGGGGSSSGDGGSSSGGGGGGTVPPPKPPEDPKVCNDEKCPACGKCLNPTKPNCQKCNCTHNHNICDLCGRCYKPIDDICITKTRSIGHSENCIECSCWYEIDQDYYATREARARSQLKYIAARGGSGGKNFAADMNELFEVMQRSKIKMVDIYPIYNMIESEFKQLKGLYMLNITKSFAEYGSIIIDIAYLKCASEDAFLIFREFIMRKSGLYLSRSAWTGSKSEYFEPLGQGSTAKLPDSRANAINFNEELVIREVKSNPAIGSCIKENLKDVRWYGWCKYQYIHYLRDGSKINVHYVVKIHTNGIIEAIDDIKFKL